MNHKNILLGDFLIKQGLITEKQLNEALQFQEENGNKLLGRSLIDLGFINENEIIKALGNQLGVQIVTLKNIHVPIETIQVLPEAIAKTYKLLPLHRSEETLTVGMANPLDLIAIDAVSKTTGLKVKPVVCRTEEINEAIDYYYRVPHFASDDNSNSLLNSDENLDYLVDPSSIFTEDDKVYRSSDDVSVSHLVHLLLVQAVHENALNIHLEPKPSGLLVRYRINNELKEYYNHSQELSDIIISTIKNLACLDVNRCDIPQMGSFNMRIKENDVHFQVASFPTIFGESLVVKILRSNSLRKINELGISKKQLNKVATLLSYASGLVWIAGPIDSGKTTTLYAALLSNNSSVKNILTYERELFRPFDKFCQFQAKYHNETTFSNVMDSIFKQDADIIALDDYYDSQMLDLAGKMALKGKLIYATLPMTSMARVISYLAQKSIDPYYIAETTRGIITQLLIKKICPKCKEQYNPSKNEIEKLKEIYNYSDEILFHGKGCSECRSTGYWERVAVFESLIFDDTIRELINLKATSAQINKYIYSGKNLPIMHETIKKMVSGETTLAEVFRVKQLL